MKHLQGGMVCDISVAAEESVLGMGWELIVEKQNVKCKVDQRILSVSSALGERVSLVACLRYYEQSLQQNVVFWIEVTSPSMLFHEPKSMRLWIISLLYFPAHPLVPVLGKIMDLTYISVLRLWKGLGNEVNNH